MQKYLILLFFVTSSAYGWSQSQGDSVELDRDKLTKATISMSAMVPVIYNRFSVERYYSYSYARLAVGGEFGLCQLFDMLAQRMWNLK